MGLTISVGLLADLKQRNAKGAQVFLDALRNLNDCHREAPLAHALATVSMSRASSRT